VELKIIRYTDEHCDGSRDLIAPIQQGEFGIPISYEDQPDPHDIHGFYRKGRGEFRVAIVDAGIVGSIATLDIGAGYRKRSGCTAQDVRKKIEVRRMARRGNCCNVLSITSERPALPKFISGQRRLFPPPTDFTKKPDLRLATAMTCAGMAGLVAFDFARR
jgi:hypothetical protein